MNDTNEIHFINSKGEKCIMHIHPHHTFLNGVHRRSPFISNKWPSENLPFLLWTFYKRNGYKFYRVEL